MLRSVKRPLWLFFCSLWSHGIIVTPTFMSQQDFLVGAGRAGAHFNLFCIRLQLMIIFILDESADYFLSQSIVWFCKNSEEGVILKWEMSSQWTRVQSRPVYNTVCLFQPTVQSFTWSQTHSHHSDEKQQFKVIFCQFTHWLKLQSAKSGNQVSCCMRLLRKQLGCTLPSLFLLRLAFYFVCCCSFF